MNLALFVVLILGVGAQAKAVSFFEMVLEEFQLFKLQHSKAYVDATEEKFRMKIYNENKHKIAMHNQRYERDLENFSMAINQFGDLLHHEFASLMNGFKKSNKTRV